MRSYSENTQRAIDEEVARLSREAEQAAIDLLASHRAELDRLVTMLLEEETVDGASPYELVGRSLPGPASERRVVQGDHGVPVVVAPET